jgi:hypothetical protein
MNLGWFILCFLVLFMFLYLPVTILKKKKLKSAKTELGYIVKKFFVYFRIKFSLLNLKENDYSFQIRQPAVQE